MTEGSDVVSGRSYEGIQVTRSVCFSVVARIVIFANCTTQQPSRKGQCSQAYGSALDYRSFEYIFVPLHHLIAKNIEVARTERANAGYIDAEILQDSAATKH